MRVSKVTVSRLKNTGNFENERIEVEVTLEDHESPSRAVQRARAFLAAHLGDDSGDRLAEAILRRAGRGLGTEF